MSYIQRLIKEAKENVIVGSSSIDIISRMVLKCETINEPNQILNAVDIGYVGTDLGEFLKASEKFLLKQKTIKAQKIVDYPIKINNYSVSFVSYYDLFSFKQDAKIFPELFESIIKNNPEYLI